MYVYILTILLSNTVLLSNMVTKVHVHVLLQYLYIVCTCIYTCTYNVVSYLSVALKKSKSTQVLMSELTSTCFHT